MKQQYITATNARKNFFDLIEEAKKGVPVNISVKGTPEVVLVAKEYFDGLIATLETYEDPELMEAIREGEEDIKAGRTVPLEQVMAELGMEHMTVADKAKKYYVPSQTVTKGRKGSKKAR